MQAEQKGSPGRLRPDLPGATEQKKGSNTCQCPSQTPLDHCLGMCYSDLLHPLA